jgi:hypothetical protein
MMMMRGVKGQRGKRVTGRRGRRWRATRRGICGWICLPSGRIRVMIRATIRASSLTLATRRIC